MSTKKILITGGTGVLGKELTKYCLVNNINHYSPNSSLCDITNIQNISSILKEYDPDIIIHTAAYVDTLGCEKNKDKAIDLNIIGVANLVKCIPSKTKFVYISSEYVFSGNKGLYSIEDRLDPINVYGKTKSAAEYIVSILDNHQIIRVPFIKKIHKNVFENQFCSRYFIEEVPEKIINNVLYNSDKIVHICRNRIKLSDIYKERNIPAECISIPDELKNIIPKDTSLVNTNKF
jgi:dTDP-4-dehydrorhamnose reductase